MISFHHITHAVCIVIISILCKKYTELSSLHNDLKFEVSQMKLLCHNDQSHVADSMHNGLCRCPCPPGQPFVQSQTDFKHQFQAFSEQGRQPGSASSHQRFMEVSDSGVPVDDFGRSFSQPDENSQHRPDINGNAASTDFQFTSQLPPLEHIPLVQPSVTSASMSQEMTVSEPAHARPSIDRQTNINQKADVSFQKTSESLERVAVSPSSVLPHSRVKPSIGGNDRNTFEESLGDSDRDYYLGSSSSENVMEQEEDVIVTSISDSSGKVIYPHGVDLQQENVDIYDDDGYTDEWEEEEEHKIEEEDEKPHPAFGKVKLQELSEEEVDRLSADGSSVQCTGTRLSDRICHFRHLCFRPDTRQFVFLLSPRSVQENVPKMKPQEALLELSTIAGHNAQYFSYITVSASSIKRFRVAIVTGTTMVFRRFKPDNIMHVFHDDIIPLFHTLLYLNIRAQQVMGQWKFPVSLFLSDENNEGEFYNLYDTFPSGDAFTANSLEASFAQTGSSDQGMVCFTDAHAGLSKTPTWYQYGFFQPQGPIQDSAAESQHIHNVCSYLLNSFSKNCPLCGDGGHLVLISRKETRRILNEMELVLAISKQFRVKVMTVSLDTHTLDDIIPVIHTSLGIIGTHGSLLSLASFLRQGSIVVELFPYAVNPDHYTPYQTLARLPGMLLAYRAWANQDKDSSVMHPDWSAEFGGVEYLPVEEQSSIVSQTEVPAHLCCEDPSWLFHIFQDTHVNIPQVLSIIASALEEARPWQNMESNTHTSADSDLPGPPQKLKCRAELSGRLTLNLQWSPPWNVHMFASSSVSYRILVQEVDSGNVVFTSLCSAPYFAVTQEVKQSYVYRVWVRGVVNGVQGPFAAVDVCSTKL